MSSMRTIFIVVLTTKYLISTKSSAIIKEKVTTLFEKLCSAFASGEGQGEADKQFTSKQITKKVKGIFRKELKDLAAS